MYAGDASRTRWQLVIADKATFKRVFRELAETLDYSNFKDRIGQSPDQRDKLDMYHRWWADMLEFPGERE